METDLRCSDRKTTPSTGETEVEGLFKFEVSHINNGNLSELIYTVNRLSIETTSCADIKYFVAAASHIMHPDTFIVLLDFHTFAYKVFGVSAFII